MLLLRYAPARALGASPPAHTEDANTVVDARSEQARAFRERAHRPSDVSQRAPSAKASASCALRVRPCSPPCISSGPAPLHPLATEFAPAQTIKPSSVPRGGAAAAAGGEAVAQGDRPRRAARASVLSRCRVKSDALARQF